MCVWTVTANKVLLQVDEDAARIGYDLVAILQYGHLAARVQLQEPR